MKTNRPPCSAASGFTLVEVAIATGIAAGVLAILTMVVGALSSDVQRLKPYEASKRRAFVNSGAPASTPPSSSTGTGTSTTSPTPPTDSTPSTPTVSLPDDNLDPSKRPDASQPPPDPNAPPPTPTPDPTSGSTGTSGTSAP